MLYKNIPGEVSLGYSYNLCKNIFHKHAKSYYIGACFFDFGKFKNISAFYALVRVVDDIVDSNESITEKTIKLHKIKTDFYFLLNIKNTLEQFIICKKKLISILTTNWDIWKSRHPIFKAVIASTIMIDIDNSLFDKFFNSMEMDLTKFVYNTVTELEQYVEGSAMIIGELMLYIMLYKTTILDLDKKLFIKENMGFAKGLGYSFQYTNFIRDIWQDYHMVPSRIYLPSNNLKDIMGSLETENNLENSTLLKNEIQYNIHYNKLMYEYSDLGINNLYNIGHNIGNSIKISRILYSSILDKIIKNDYDVKKRTSLTVIEKINIIYKNTNIINMLLVVMNYIIYTYLYRILIFVESFLN